MHPGSDEVPDPFANGRDLPLDLIRGIAMFLVVINHLPIPSYYYMVTVDRIGVVTGAELFVIISGFVLGMVHRARIEQRGWKESAGSLFRRSLQIYATILGVTVAIWLLNSSFCNLDALMRWTDPSTGQTYAAIPTHPLENVWNSFSALLRLRLTPPQINILGYFAIMSALAPCALWLLHKKQTPLLLATSWLLYLVNLSLHLRVTPAIFENPFPLLSWQLPFINALAIGYHRPELAAFLQRTKLQPAIFSACASFALLCLFFTWNNPWFHGFQYDKIPQWARLSLIPPNLFDLIYAKIFGDRTWLFLGRLLDATAILVILYILLKKFWRRAYQVAGWFFIPIGQASLYVFVMHLWIVALLSTPVAQNHRMLVNTVLHTFALFTLWLMVKTRFLFKIVPR